MSGVASASLWIGSILGFLAVLSGAFGAHALRARLSPDLLAIWKTANEYHFYHAFALLIVGVLARQERGPALDLPATFFLAGTAVFCGSLYVLALSGARWLGAVTPIGGLLFLAGWAALAWALYRG